jgi:hypothetical protein
MTRIFVPPNKKEPLVLLIITEPLVLVKSVIKISLNVF